jgi:signal transduction histidine kinase
MTVFGALLDGLFSGALAALACSGCAAVLVRWRGSADPLFLLTVFAAISAWCLYLSSLSFTWIYGGLILRRQQGAEELDRATAATVSLARTLSEEVTQANARLQQSLAGGLDGLAQATELRQILVQARAQVPADAPHDGQDPAQVLDALRDRVHRFFLWVALGVSVTAGLLTSAFGLPQWQLGLVVAIVTAALLRLGRRGPAGWHLRLQLFLTASLSAFAADVWLSREQPPAASLVFLPVIAFYAGMLGSPWLAGSVSALAFGLLTWAHEAERALPGQSEALAVLGLLTLALAGVSSATLPLYSGVLRELEAQEKRLRQSLSAYRRLVSTLFHDLANPLAVLQGLAALPAALRSPEDLGRAQRMVLRLRSVSDEARGAANRRAGQQETSARGLADGLRDLFAERMAERSLQWMVQVPADLKLRQGGNLLETVLAKLMSNAVRFAPSGSVLRFSAGREDGGRWLRFEDSGPGFPEEALRDLAVGRAPRPTPGAGGELGNGFSLLLAQVDAQDLGGRLTVSNPAEGGARAELWLPD